MTIAIPAMTAKAAKAAPDPEFWKAETLEPKFADAES
jgi:hypothetical protein